MNLNIENKDAEAALEKATLQLFQSLKWETLHAENEVDGDAVPLGREHQGEVVLKRCLFPKLQALNSNLPPEALQNAFEIFSRDRSVMSLNHANQDVYHLLKNGVRISFQNGDSEETFERVRLIDWEEPENNHFLIVSQLWVNGDPY
jgi:type I restriction enzyme R subunit